MRLRRERHTLTVPHLNMLCHADAFASDMLEHGIKVRGADYPSYDTYSRISTGRLEELDYFTEILPQMAQI